MAGLPGTVVITDTSTGDDADITQRAVYLRNSKGQFVVPEGTDTDYVLWDIDDTSIDIAALTKDMALTVIVQWLDVNDVVLYDKTLISCLTAYNNQFDYGLVSALAQNFKRTNDMRFDDMRFKLRLYIDDANQAVSLGADVVRAQVCLDLATEIRLGAAYYFNLN